MLKLSMTTNNPEKCNAGLIDKMKKFASNRKLEDLTIGPVLTQTTDQMLGHVQKLYVRLP